MCDIIHLPNNSAAIKFAEYLNEYLDGVSGIKFKSGITLYVPLEFRGDDICEKYPKVNNWNVLKDFIEKTDK